MFPRPGRILHDYSGWFICRAPKDCSGTIMTESTPGTQQLFVFEHDAGRLELLIRIVYWILIGLVAAVYGFIATIILFVQWFHILFLARRNQFLSDFAKGYLEYIVHVMSYTYIMTDKRPDIMPVPVKIVEEC
jgi:hypothetical protein